MKSEIAMCKICGNKIDSQVPRFYFPKLPQWHNLSRWSSSILHIDCVKSIDDKHEIGKTLADIVQDLALKSKFEPFLHRSGNIVVRGRLDEKAIEILNFEDFIEMSFPVTSLEKILLLTPTESISSRTQTIYVLKDSKIKIESKLFTVYLSELNFLRLKDILESPEIRACFKN